MLLDAALWFFCFGRTSIETTLAPTDTPPTQKTTTTKNQSATARLVAGETLPLGIQRIRAADASRKPPRVQPSGTAAKVVAAVFDSGVDASHPDLNVVGGVSFVSNGVGNGSVAVEGGGLVDGFGHGTFVAGIIGAKNTGKGIVGVVPGAKIFSVQTLDETGTGVVSDQVAAFEWLRVNGRKRGVRVVNYSISIDGETSAALCQAIAGVTATGISVVVVAGNAARNMLGDGPADCAQALAVTAITDYDGKPGGKGESPYGPDDTELDDTPASFSSWGTKQVANRTLAAPGVDILSSVPAALCESDDRWFDCESGADYGLTGNGTYARGDGTSFAAPHAAGVLVRCYIAGSCRSDKKTEVGQIVAAASRAGRANRGAYGFQGDPLHPIEDQYYGWLLVMHP